MRVPPPPRVALTPLPPRGRRPRRPAFRSAAVRPSNLEESLKYLAARCIPDWSPKSLAVYIVGMITVPLGARSLIVNTEAVERGTTGLREAMYGVTYAKSPAEDAPVVRLNSMEEFFDRVREAAAMVLPSDAEAFDALVETHPLSRVRRRQRWVLENLRLGLELKALLLAAAN